MADQSAVGQFTDLIPGIIPFGSICLLSGPPHRGKTALLVTLLARLLKGDSLFGIPTCQPPAIGFICTDHKHQLNQSQWLSRAGIVDAVTLYSLRNDLNFEWERLRKAEQRSTAFDDCLERLQLPEGSLVIVDPVALFISSQLNDYHSVAIGLGKLDQILQRRNLTMWGTAHTSKLTDDPKKTYKRPIDRINGSGAQIGFADTAMALTGPEDTPSGCYELAVSPAMVPEFTYYYQRDDQGLFVPGVPLHDVGVDADLIDPNDPAEILATLIHATMHRTPPGISTTDLRAQVKDKMSKTTFYRVLGELRMQGRIDIDGHGWITLQTAKAKDTQSS